MDENQDRETPKETVKTRKSPLDAKIVGWLFFCDAIIVMLIGLALITGIGHLSDNSSRSFLFGLLTITSELSHGVYTLFLGFAIFAGALGLIKGRKYGWWIMLVSSLYCILDNYLVQVNKGMYPMWGLYMLSLITAWLLFRSKVYGIRIIR
ncbi:MAG: hypothetical protein FVQ85_13885 [Planctomycetes bacterium]|nr:hypothetical protein [Planctomycetota bacterium]